MDEQRRKQIKAREKRARMGRIATAEAEGREPPPAPEVPEPAGKRETWGESGTVEGGEQEGE